MLWESFRYPPKVPSLPTNAPDVSEGGSDWTPLGSFADIWPSNIELSSFLGNIGGILTIKDMVWSIHCGYFLTIYGLKYSLWTLFDNVWLEAFIVDTFWQYMAWSIHSEHFLTMYGLRYSLRTCLDNEKSNVWHWYHFFVCNKMAITRRPMHLFPWFPMLLAQFFTYYTLGMASGD